MKKQTCVILLAAMLLACACGNKEQLENLAGQTVDITGQWQLTGAELTTKAVQIGTEQVDIYLDFKADKSLVLYQMLGRGRYTLYTGTWNLSGTQLSGTYTGGKKPRPWANVYTVGVEGETLKMNATVGSSDVYTYTRCQIPGNLEVYPKK